MKPRLKCRHLFRGSPQVPETVPVLAGVLGAALNLQVPVQVLAALLVARLDPLNPKLSLLQTWTLTMTLFRRQVLTRRSLQT